MAFYEDEPRDPSLDFLEQSYLSYVVPATTNFAPERALKDLEATKQSPLDGIEQREWLFFGTRFAHGSDDVFTRLIHKSQMRPSTYT
jgi:hypothetical protein